MGKYSVAAEVLPVGACLGAGESPGNRSGTPAFPVSSGCPGGNQNGPAVVQ